MPGTPDMYKHLNNEETNKHTSKLFDRVFVAVRLATQVTILGLIVHPRQFFLASKKFHTFEFIR